MHEKNNLIHTMNVHPSSIQLKIDQGEHDVTTLIRDKRGHQPEKPVGIVEQWAGKPQKEIGMITLEDWWGAHGEEGVTALGARTE